MGENIEKVWLPQSLAIGIPYETFWKLNPKLIKPFAKVFKDKKEEEREIINYTAWLNGIYIRDAIGSCLSKNGHYPDKPLDLKMKPLTVKENAEQFGNFATAFNNKFKKSEGQ